MTLGYHYIRYGCLSIYIAFLLKTFDWLSYDVVPVKTVSVLGTIVTIIILVTDIRTYRQWRKECERLEEDPGRPKVSKVLRPFYVVCAVWFSALWPIVNIEPLEPIKSWFPGATSKRESPGQESKLSEPLKKEIEELIERKLTLEKECKELERNAKKISNLKRKTIN